MEGGKPENPEKNPRSTGEINYDNSIHTSPKFESQHGGCTQMVTHPATDPVRPGLTWSSVLKGNALTEKDTIAQNVRGEKIEQLSFMGGVQFERHLANFFKDECNNYHYFTSHRFPIIANYGKHDVLLAPWRRWPWSRRCFILRSFIVRSCRYLAALNIYYDSNGSEQSGLL